MKKYTSIFLLAVLAVFAVLIPQSAFATHTESHRPDLVVENARISGLTLTYTVRNIGTAAISGLSYASYGWITDEGTANSSFMDTLMLDLDPDETRDVTYTFLGIPSWVVSVRVSANVPWNVTELNTGNNSQTVDLADAEPLPPLDFVVTSASLSAGRVDYTIRNDGEGPFTGSVTTRFVWVNNSNENVFSGENLFHTLSGTFPVGGTMSGSLTLGVPRIGATRMRAEADYRNYLPETDETNNTLTIVIPTSYFADLTLANAVLEGNTVTFDVRNIGGPYLAGITNLRYVNRRENNSSISIFTDTVPNVAPGATIRHSFTLPAIPSSAASILIEVDSGLSIIEGNETNNTISVPVTLGSQLDFTVSEADFDVTSVSFTITNRGTRAFDEILPHHLQWISATGAVLATSVGGGPVSLPAGGSVSYTRSGDSFILGRPTGAAYLRITANPSGAMHVPEFDSDNNSYDIDIAPILAEAFPPPDFSIESPQLLEDRLRFTLRNSGGEVDDVITYRLEWLGSGRNVLATVLGTFYSVLGRDETREVVNSYTSFFLGRPDGAASLRITLNPEGSNHIEETNTANNVLEVPYVPPALPDFNMSDGSLTSSAVTFVMNNAGPGDFSGSLVYRLDWLNEGGTVLSTQFGAANLPSFPSGASSVRAHSGDAFMLGRPSSAARLRVTLNPSGAFQTDEVNTVDNTLELSVGSIAMPEPDAEADDSPPDFVVAIDELASQRARLTIRNNGEGSYTGLLTWRFAWVDDRGTALASTVDGDVVSLAPDGTFSVTRENIVFLLGRPADAVALRVIVNPNNGGAFVSSESNTGNNSAERAIARRGLPDFSVDSLILNPTTIEFTVRNLGGDSAGGVGYVVEWLNGNRETLLTGTGAIVERLPIGRAVSVRHGGSFVYARPDGAVYLKATVNPVGGALSSPETNSENNSVELRLVDDETSGDDLIEEEEEEAADEVSEEAGDYEPESAPGKVRLFFRNIGQGLKIALATDPIEKAELRLRHANEKLVNAQLMLAEGEPDRAAKELERYNRNMDKASTALERAVEKESDGAKQLVERVLSNQLNHQVLLGVFERAAGDKASNVDKIRQNISAGVGRAVELMDKDDATAVLTHELTKHGNPLSVVRALEVLAGVAAKAPDAAAGVIEDVRERLADKFSSQYRALPVQNQRMVVEYMEKTVAPEADKLKAIESIKANGEIGDSGSTDGEYFINKARSETLQRFDQQIQKAVDAGDKSAGSLLKAFERGTADDVRILSELENRLPEDVKPAILTAKDKALQAFVKDSDNLEKLKDSDVSPEIKLQVFDVVEAFVKKSPSAKDGDISVSKGVLQTLEVELPALKHASVVESTEKKNDLSKKAVDASETVKKEDLKDKPVVVEVKKETSKKDEKPEDEKKVSTPTPEIKEKYVAPVEKKQIEIKQTEPVKTEVLKTDSVKIETPKVEVKTETKTEVKTETLKEESVAPIKETTIKETTYETTTKETTTNETGTKTTEDSTQTIETKTTDTSGTTASSTTKSTTDQSTTIKDSTGTKVFIKGY